MRFSSLFRALVLGGAAIAGGTCGTEQPSNGTPVGGGQQTSMGAGGGAADLDGGTGTGGHGGGIDKPGGNGGASFW